MPWPAREREIEGERKLIRKDRKFIRNVSQDGWYNARYLKRRGRHASLPCSRAGACPGKVDCVCCSASPICRARAKPGSSVPALFSPYKVDCFCFGLKGIPSRSSNSA